MTEKDRKKQLLNIFENVSDAEKILIDQLINEVVYLEMQMEMLRGIPHIEVHPNNPAKTRSTAAAKQYKECSQSYMNAIRILLNVLRKTDTDAANELLKRLEEYA